MAQNGRGLGCAFPYDTGEESPRKVASVRKYITNDETIALWENK
jgi:hypothetical protein